MRAWVSVDSHRAVGGGVQRGAHCSRVLAMSLALVLGSVVLEAQAFDLDELLHPALPRDPLQVMPPVLRDGAVLPGDEAPVACADDPASPGPMTLEAAIDLAMCGNPQVRAAWAAVKVQAGALGEAKAAYLPTLTGSLSRLSDKTWFPEGKNDAMHVSGNTVYAALTWRLLDFGGREANLGAARSLLAAASATHGATLQKTLAAVIQAYFDVQTAQAAVAAKQEAQSIADSTLQTARRRELRGAGSSGETLQAETTLARARLDASRAEGELNKARAVMAYAVGLPSGTVIDLAPLEEPRVEELSSSLSDWLAQAQRFHPAIEAARAQVEAARAHAEAVRSEGLPSLDLSASFYQNGRPGQGLSTTQTRERIVGLTLNVPIFEGFARGYKIQRAEASIEQRDAELHDVEHRVAMEVIQAYSDADASLRNLDASQALLSAARSSLASSQRKYERGAADVMEILNTQKALADARQERIRCLSEWRSASLRIVSAAGRLGRMKLSGSRVD